MRAGDRDLDSAHAGEPSLRGPRINYFGLFVGINDYAHLRSLQYAEADAVAIHDVMTHARSGTIPADHARLLTGDVDRDRLTSELTWLMSNRSTTDVVCLYVAGHGIEVNDRVYLATIDTSVANLQVNRTAALAMRQLRHDFFEETQAGLVVFVLDCCYSGALADPTRSSHLDMSEGYFQRSSGRVAVMACAADERARESSTTGHGIFTGHFLDALRGKAISGAGTVTLEGAIAYVNVEMGEGQRPGYFGNQFGSAVLTTPSPRELRVEQVARQPVEPAIDASIDLSAPRHPIDSFEEIIAGVVSRLGEAEPSLWGVDDDQRERHGLGIVRDVLGASSAFVVRYERVGDSHMLQRLLRESDGTSAGHDAELAETVAAVDGGLRSTFVAPHTDTAFAIFVPNSSSSTYHLALAIESNAEAQWTDVLIIANIPADSPLLGDPTSRIIRALFMASSRFKRIDPVAVEASILDELRRTMGLLPLRMYLRRLDLFADQLNDLAAHFQPVVHLFRPNPTIHSWEALARNSAGHTPSGVFAAAELWGAQFMAQLDSYMLDSAVSRFAEQSNAAPEQQGRSHALSVNCYPSSLVKDGYVARLREILGRNLIPPRDLTLEISEKSELPMPRGLVADTSTATIESNFRRTIQDISREHAINFAIDDFGVGHSSIGRLLGLGLQYVKVDRELLRHDAARVTFQYIRDVVHYEQTMVPTIVAEGYEGAKDELELGDLMDLGIDYVQGFGLRRPAPTVGPLTADERAFVIDRMQIRRGKNGFRE